MTIRDSERHSYGHAWLHCLGDDGHILLGREAASTAMPVNISTFEKGSGHRRMPRTEIPRLILFSGRTAVQTARGAGDVF